MSDEIRVVSIGVPAEKIPKYPGSWNQAIAEAKRIMADPNKTGIQKARDVSRIQLGVCGHDNALSERFLSEIA